eukprot:5010986-Prymnesium_polylepis.1
MCTCGCTVGGRRKCSASHVHVPCAARPVTVGQQPHISGRHTCTALIGVLARVLARFTDTRANTRP